MKTAETELLEDPIEWGRRLIETEDHDPLYSALVRWNVSGARRRRFLLAYWCCYSVGASWWLSNHSGSRFWDQLYTAAENIKPAPIGDRWPRAHERRHWRGQKSIDCVAELQRRFKHPEEAVLGLEGLHTLEAVSAQVLTWPQFGPWIAFKVADMLERVLGTEVEFSSTIMELYKDPKEGARMAGEVWEMTPEEAVDHLLRSLGDMTAPGATARPVGIQEVETVLCKWKSARRGHYELGKDTRDHRRELERWGAQDLLSAYPTMAD